MGNPYAADITMHHLPENLDRYENQQLDGFWLIPSHQDKAILVVNWRPMIRSTVFKPEDFFNPGVDHHCKVKGVDGKARVIRELRSSEELSDFLNTHHADEGFDSDCALMWFERDMGWLNERTEGQPNGQ